MGRKALKDAQRRAQRDSKSLYESVKESGLDPMVLAHLTSVTYKITDVAEQISLEIISMLKGTKMSFSDSRDIKQLNQTARRLQKSATIDLMNGAAQDGIDPLEYAEDFGSSCDFIREVIELSSIINKDEDRIKAISTLKLLTRK